MHLTRRKFLTAAVATTAAAGLMSVPFVQAQQHWLVSCGSDGSNNYFVAAMSLDGKLISKIQIPARGHDVISLPNKPGRALVFARRPGTFAIEVDFINHRIVKEINPQLGLHFYGHGVISTKNHVLITSENDFSSGDGQIVLRDVSNYQVLARYPSGGVGPHQIAMMPDGNTLVIANGGIKTHPELPRKKLNLDTMQPNLAYLDISTGKLLATYQLENKYLSIRHLDVSKKGKVIAALQYQGIKTDIVPLVVSHQGEEQLSFLHANENIWRAMNQYTASVCIDNEHNRVAVSCPRSDSITYWSLTKDQFIGSEKLKDGAGLAFINDMYASSGKGHVIELLAGKNKQQSLLSARSMSFSGIRWDNHMTAVIAG
ncbi:MAG: hypothetical protein ACI9LM_004744 [Alteromonadaceae bacterium]|jgi:hypothetical protein